MNKILFGLLLVTTVFAANSPFNRVRVASYDSNGVPEEEIIDLSICVERTPDNVYKNLYESVLGYFADGVYEMSNGGNFLGNVIVYTGGRFCSSTAIKWNIDSPWPGSGGGFGMNYGGIEVSDYWGESKNHIKDDYYRFDFGMTLAHEAVHYFYGLDDEYAKTSLINEYSISVDPFLNKITITNPHWEDDAREGSTKFQDRLSPFVKGTPVIFYVDNDGESSIPLGLSEGPIQGYGYFVTDYATIDQVWDSSSTTGSYSFNLKGLNDQYIDIQSYGTGKLRMDLPTKSSGLLQLMNKNYVAHSIMSRDGDVATSRKQSSDGIDGIQWQWANLSTEFNINPNSPQGMCCRDENGNPVSAWEKIVSDPYYDVVYGKKQRNTRYWFKSLIKRKPTESDVFTGKSFLKNYNPVTGKVMDGYAVWIHHEHADSAQTYNIPFMKVELSGRSQSDYRRDTHKYLNIQWVDRPKVEVIVLEDVSLSMGAAMNKMDKANQMAKYVAGAFLSADSNYDISNVSVGVYAFSDSLFLVHPPGYNNPSITQIYSEIDALVAINETALYDALYDVFDKFSTDPASLKILYVISDGKDVGSLRTLEQVMNRYRSSEISIHTIAYGSHADRKLLSSMAAETGGMYFEELNGQSLKIVEASTNPIAAMPGNTQIKSATVAPTQISNEIHVPQRIRHARIYTSYDISSSSSTGTSLALLTQGNATIPFFCKSDTIGSTVYNTIEIDSTTIASLPSSVFKIKNMLSNSVVNFRVVAMGEFQDYSMNVSLFPEGLFEWPMQKYFTASIRGPKGTLADVTATGTLVKPDGSEVHFSLNDDGKNGDFRAGDGLYFANMPPISADGVYQWEITITNPNGIAHTTRVGKSLPDTIPFIEEIDSTPFEFVRNGQFIVTGCCKDEPNDQLLKLRPQKIVSAYLQSGWDVDHFEIEGTLAGKSYMLSLSSIDLGSFYKISVNSPNNPDVSDYFVYVNQTGSGYVSVPLSAEYAKSGNIVNVIGTNSSGANYDLVLLEKETAEFSVGRFEVATDWHSQHTTLALDGNRKSEGNTSLVTPAGWKTIESRNISTSDFDVIGERMSVDVLVPASTQNPYWIGTLELWLYVPSSNKRIQLGEQIQLDPYFGNWKSYEFRVPSRVKKVLSEQHHDARFQIVLNTADSLWIDNLRFVGKLTDNPVNQVEPECPQDNGCGSSTPIMLHVNESKRVVPEGDLWIEITGFPNDWTPAVVTLGIAPEDGVMMTGSMTYDNGTYPLSGWYMEKSFGFVRGKRYLVKLHNLGHRPYRVNAWVSGQAMGVASLGLPYNVELGVNW